MANYCYLKTNAVYLQALFKKFRVNQGPSAVHKVMFEFNDNVFA